MQLDQKFYKYHLVSLVTSYIKEFYFVPREQTSRGVARDYYSTDYQRNMGDQLENKFLTKEDVG